MFNQSFEAQDYSDEFFLAMPKWSTIFKTKFTPFSVRAPLLCIFSSHFLSLLPVLNQAHQMKTAPDIENV